MSAYKFVTLTCDCCGEIFDDGRSLRIREARSSAAGEGWTSSGRGNYDWCASCHGLNSCDRNHFRTPTGATP